MGTIPYVELENLSRNYKLDLMGVVPADWSSVASEFEQLFKEWLDQNNHGSMQWLESHQSLKYNPHTLLEGARSVIVVGMNYYQEAPWSPGVLVMENSGGRVARYAWGRDYHKTLKQELIKLEQQLVQSYPGSVSRSFTDSGPLHERLAALGSGFAFTGRNTLSINKKLGSWFFLGVVITDLDIEATGNVLSPGSKSTQGECPPSCQRCLDICPTGALTGPHQIDASRCISYLTIEHKGSIPVELRPLMGDWIFGCDLCQEVCPFNQKVEQTGVADFTTYRAGSVLELSEILGIRDDAAFTSRFAGSALMRGRRENLLRNACIAAANSGALDVLLVLEKLAHNDASRVVREHALWAVEQLSG